MELFLNATNHNLLEEIPEAERVSFYDDESDTFSQIEEIEAEHTDVIVQPLPTNSLATELPIETAIVNITNSQCPLLFVNNTPNSIKLHPNQLFPVAEHPLRSTEDPTHCQVATATADHDLTDHEPATLDKSLQCHTDQQKLDFALNKMTAKTYVLAVQKAKALRML
uniref:Uncharacterized protein n=1 Tax=Romanomermis culicivorax TaxID=13658 RepID=A0A915HGT8_ROMCU